jgi:BolA family transcriptional regulator, general stress-responsive regulator
MLSVREQIVARLQPLKATRLDVIDDSASHAGHVGAQTHAARSGLAAAAIEGTHFELTVVSAAFTGKPLVARHRMIYDLLDDLMKTRIHALKIDARPA